jgi:hypothetical protein
MSTNSNNDKFKQKLTGLPRKDTRYSHSELNERTVDNNPRTCKEIKSMDKVKCISA